MVLMFYVRTLDPVRSAVSVQLAHLYISSKFRRVMLDDSASIGLLCLHSQFEIQFIQSRASANLGSVQILNTLLFTTIKLFIPPLTPFTLLQASKFLLHITQNICTENRT